MATQKVMMKDNELIQNGDMIISLHSTIDLHRWNNPNFQICSQTSNGQPCVTMIPPNRPDNASLGLYDGSGTCAIVIQTET
ncbi:hypothetical protein AVEN_263825-1 [Araneus ventricosus]|uniref:Uncharacterized protein n=1 Tax=Araneus ventricosus TaxID=182803 RepID=A0A4Y2LS10_ARAVE|nr:hypothetical protein AVEN_263825-1 [Araneus ventricosus]